MGLKTARVVVLSDGGRLALQLEHVFRQDFQDLVVLPSRQHDPRQWSISRTLRDLLPDLVVYAASLDDVALCERQPSQAYEINCVGAQNVALACSAVGADLVYVSAASVFPAGADSPCCELHTPSPVNALGRSKLAGEVAIREALPQHYIVRTSWLFGYGPYAKPSAEHVVAHSSGVLGNPTYVADLAEAISRLVRTGRYGTYHLVNEGEASLADFLAAAQSLCADDPALETAFPLDLSAIDQSNPGQLLTNSLAAKQLGIALRPWRAALLDYVRDRRERNGS